MAGHGACSKPHGASPVAPRLVTVKALGRHHFASFASLHTPCAPLHTHAYAVSPDMPTQVYCKHLASQKKIMTDAELLVTCAVLRCLRSNVARMHLCIHTLYRGRPPSFLFTHAPSALMVCGLLCIRGSVTCWEGPRERLWYKPLSYTFIRLSFRKNFLTLLSRTSRGSTLYTLHRAAHLSNQTSAPGSSQTDPVPPQRTCHHLSCRVRLKPQCILATACHSSQCREAKPLHRNFHLRREVPARCRIVRKLGVYGHVSLQDGRCTDMCSGHRNSCSI